MHALQRQHRASAAHLGDPGGLLDGRFEATVRFDTVENGGRWAALGLDLTADGSVPWWIATMRSQTTAANGIEFAERTAANPCNVPVAAAAPTAADARALAAG